MSGQRFKKTHERDLTLQVLQSRNGQWLYRHQVVNQIQLLDQRFSEQAIFKAFAELLKSNPLVQERRNSGARGALLYRYYDPSKPISTKTDFDSVPVRPSSMADVEWPDE